jgi:hypothetical protein
MEFTSSDSLLEIGESSPLERISVLSASSKLYICCALGRIDLNHSLPAPLKPVFEFQANVRRLKWIRHIWFSILSMGPGSGLKPWYRDYQHHSQHGGVWRNEFNRYPWRERRSINSSRKTGIHWVRHIDADTACEELGCPWSSTNLMWADPLPDCLDIGSRF